jgi:hypothetical protein
MPLPPPNEREPLHTRSIVCEGYRRADGLFDIEARLVDSKPRPYALLSGVRSPGEPVHDMWIRFTIDRQYRVVDVAASMDAVPYPGGCDTIAPDYRALVGANLVEGFRKAVHERLGGVRGCSHLSELAALLPTAAIQTFAGLKRENDGDGKPFQLDRCHALETRTETVRRYYPAWYRGAA